MSALGDAYVHDVYLTGGPLLVLGGFFLLLLVGLVLVARLAKSRPLWLGLYLAGALVAIPIVLATAYFVFGFRQVREMQHEVDSIATATPYSSDSQIIFEPARPTDARRPAALHEVTQESLVYPTNRPLWVSRPQSIESNAEEFTVSSDPFSSRSEAIAHLNQQLAHSLAQLASRREGEALAGEIIAAHANECTALLEIDTKGALQAPVSAGTGALLGNLYLEQVTFPQPLGEMYQAHAHVMVNEPLLQFVDSRWRTVQSQRRLVQVGSTVGGVLLGLLALSAVLRVAPRLSAKHRGRLQAS